MQIILTRDVPHVGKKHGIMTVKDGFGRNYLIPQGLAIVATAQEIDQANRSSTLREKRLAGMQEQAREIAQKVKGLTLKISKKGMKTGHLYGSVSADEIAQSIYKELGIEIDSGSILLEKPIKSAGKQKISIQLAPDTDVTVTLHVTADTGKKK